MIRIQVTIHNGAPPPQQLFADFNELGGNIGRAEGNTLVLQDSTRTISRTHASITCRDGNYYIRSLGTAIPVYLNDQPLSNGRDMVINADDEIRIDSYTMKVLAGGSLNSVHSSSRPSSASKDDPLALFGGQFDRSPFDDLLTPTFELQRKNVSAPEVEETVSGAQQPIIPSDFDLFAEPPPPSLPETRSDYAPTRTPESNSMLDNGFGPLMPDQSIDDLFGLSPRKNSEPFDSDSLLAPTHDQSDTASADPFVALGVSPRQKASVGQTQRNDVPELHGSFRPPAAKPDSTVRVILPSAPQTPSIPLPESSGMVLSWERKESDQDTDEIKNVIVPSVGHDRRKAQRRRSEQQLVTQMEAASERIDVPVTDSGFAGRNIKMPAMPIGVPTTPKSVADHDELLHAFLDGAGVPNLAIPTGLTPQFMNTLGQLLRESTQGTLNLVLARTLTRREIRADLTMISPRENNPLKFSPTVEVALAHLLTPQGLGFMAPLQAMKDVNDDLRSHQFGFMAGMRAALAGVLERFEPEELERRLTQKTVIDALLPSKRKAKLWDLFAERYKDISLEAEEDFHVLCGREFLRAYEAQVAKLEQDDKN